MVRNDECILPAGVFKTRGSQLHGADNVGSDLHPYRGAEKGLDPMTIMGHEFVGTIVEVGDHVKGFQVGDRVGSGFTTCCGECWYCSRGLTCRCEKGQLYGW